MPLIQNSDYRPPLFLLNEHWETILPALVRRPERLIYSRERIFTPDDDFLDLDFVFQDNNRIVILSHGLEGHSDKYYMRAMARRFLENNWDTLSWNCRSCSEDINLKPTLYHHGATQDLSTVIDHTLNLGYSQILLIGFSLGGSLVVKYLGEYGKDISKKIVGGIAYSIPCQLGSCAKKLSEPQNSFYLNRFMKKLKTKIHIKAKQFPAIFDVAGIDEIKSFYEFDTRYTAPLYGFNAAEDFYNYASAGNYIQGISIPVLLVNSLNDPMFPDDCYPVIDAKSHDYFYLETPDRGGHLGYWNPFTKNNWAEDRALQFVDQILGIR